MKLNIGCGDYLADGWTNVDRMPRTPDVIGERSFYALDVVVGLPWKDGSCERIYAGHVLEHLTYDDELPAALAELKRLLSDDGQMMVVGPDIDRARDGLFDEETIKGIWPGAYIPDVPGAMHQWEPTARAHEAALLAAGLSATEILIKRVTADWPVVSRIGWQLAFLCWKTNL